ncbi:hypothetical protein [Endozoicomonas ascidiicola]|uniref:hypothetical protein n=1 Tax=Endozoicomonas ascidiicola TaxID=1698521 RepID=UPI000831A3F1|nr:hypothetical protein [Endozoicomonas ascidiicola]
MKKFKILSALAFTIFLTGCATGAKMENMVFTDSSGKTYSSELKSQVSVDDVAGGKETNPAWTSEISNENFKSALKTSLESQGLYSENGKYTLSANLIDVNQPMFGLDFTVTTHIEYKLAEKQTGKIIFNKTISAPYTATVGDAFAAIKRLRLANEGSGKENIKNLLSELANIDVADISIN